MSIARLDDQLCFALYTASSRLTSIYRPLLEPLDLTYPQFVVLMALWEQDQISITLLAERTGLSKATMTPLLRRLEQKGLLERLLLAENERQKSVVLTEAGQALAHESGAITEKAFCATGLTMDEALKMIELCNRLKKTR